MGQIQSDAIEYNRKINLIRAYSGHFTEDDFEYMFETTSLAEILDRYSYATIRARLANTLSNTLDKDIEIGDVVLVNKPVMKDGAYRNVEGLVIGKHIVYDEYDKNRSPIYHTQYDVLTQSGVFLDGYTYDIRKENAEDLILKESHISGLADCMALFNSIIIDRPV